MPYQLARRQGAGRGPRPYHLIVDHPGGAPAEAVFAQVAAGEVTLDPLPLAEAEHA